MSVGFREPVAAGRRVPVASISAIMSATDFVSRADMGGGGGAGARGIAPGARGWSEGVVDGTADGRVGRPTLPERAVALVEGPA